MPEWSTLGLFTAAALVLVSLPGPNTLYIATCSLERGFLAGIASSLGIMTGTLVHTAAAAVGLSALLMASAEAFHAVRYAGAAYLIFLGAKVLLATRHHASVSPAPQAPLSSCFREGLTVNLLNPKTALFVAAFLPQFVHPERGPTIPQVLILGGLLAMIGWFNDLAYALLANRLGARLRGTPHFAQVRSQVAGWIYIGLGVTAALLGGKNR